MSVVSRRKLLQIAAAGVAVTNGRLAVAAPTPGLGEIAAKNGYLFGAAAAEVIDKDAAYRDLYVTQTRLITTAIALKMVPTETKPMVAILKALKAEDPELAHTTEPQPELQMEE